MTSTKDTILAAAIAGGRVRAIDGLPERMARHEREVAEVEQQPWLPTEKRRVVAEKVAALRTDVAALVEAARATALRGFDREEGAVRAAARDTGVGASEASIRSQVFRHTRASQLAALVDRATSPAAVRQVYAEAALTDDPDTIRLVGTAAQQRLHVLAASDRDKTISPLRDAALRFTQEHDRWRRDHPSVVERLAEIERLRGNAQIEFTASAEFAMRLFDVRLAPAAPALKDVPDVEPASDGVRIGPAFDRRA